MRRARPLSVLAAGLVLLGCGSGRGPVRPATTTSSTSPVAVQTGYGGHERFCAERPLTGSIDYDGTTGFVRITLEVGGLPRESPVALDWLNNTVRGYTIAGFSTDRSGRAVQSSLRVFRPGELRGYQVLLARSDVSQAPLGRLLPC